MTTTSNPQISPVKQIESLYQRLEKVRSICAAGKVHPILGLDGHYAVESSKGDGFYQVNGTCTCMDAQHRTEVHHGWCCHKLAVELFKEQQAIADNPQVAKDTNAATPEADRTLEDQLADLYPKARPTSLPR
jgi:hypothetical protein